MKRSITTLVLGAVVLAVYLSNSTFAQKEAMMKPKVASRAYLHGYNLPSSGVALEGYCPVCYISAGKAVKGTEKFQSTYNDVTYYFVSEEAKQMFIKSPEKYLPAYGGWCATGMALQDKFPVDPTNFKVVDGRLLLFLTNKNINAQKVWNKGNEKEQLSKANAHWKTVMQ